MSKENLMIQQGMIQLIQKEIKEIKQLIKKARKDVKTLGTRDEIMYIKSTSKELEKGILIVERELFKLKFKSATAHSVATLSEFYRMIKEEKQVLLDAYPQV